MILTGQQREILKEGILGAYPNQDELNILLSEKMELKFSIIARGDDYISKVAYLVEKLETDGRVGELIKVIVKKKPNSPYLTQVKTEFANVNHEQIAPKPFPKERLPVNMSFNDGQELSITAAFLEIPGITEIEPYDSFLAIALLHQVIESNFRNLPVVILTSLTGAIIVVPDSSNHYIHQDLQELFSQTTQRGIPLKIGVAQGGVKVFKDADESMSFIGSPMNTAARLAKSKINPCILYHESYKNKVAGSIKSKKEDPLHPRHGNSLTVEGKSHDQPFICFYPDSAALSIRQNIDSNLLSQFEEEYQGINKQVNAVIIAYDLPNFSGGDGTELSKRFRSVRDAIRDIKLNNSFPQEAKFHFSPGGDGGILVLEGEPLKSPRVYIDTAFDLIRGLEIESDYKDEKIAVKSRVGIHYGDVYLYNSAEGVPRPTGLNCFVADAIASDKIARESGGIVVTESIKDIMVSRVGRERFDQEYGDLSSIAEGPSNGMNRYFKRIENPNQSQLLSSKEVIRDSLNDEELLERLSKCPPGMFTRFLFYAKIPPGVLSSEMTSQSISCSMVTTS
jgi:hypothetical protein